MYKLICPDFRTESFHNGDHETWDRCLVYVDELEDMYHLDKGVKALFYELLQRGYCVTSAYERIQKVEEVLAAEHYEYELCKSGAQNDEKDMVLG
ncbi:hypothetical protein [Parageobacillus galactosidasius]|uniref:Uncharacterized protein n=1 Tax=Parageobacillus galactosidasius TaxID=883812 RepID=A0A226QT90_9BACL|nr:hypothetical protein [Parageobacillus galactosidasius]OXB94810.1 hypothetical protein B9L23_08080 [Parageobacillus galactosidasius]